MKRIALLLPLILLFPPPAFAGKIFGNLKEGAVLLAREWKYGSNVGTASWTQSRRMSTGLTVLMSREVNAN